VFSGGGDHEIIRSSSRDNSFLPAEFVASLEKAYTTEFARQEIEGEFAEPAGAIFKRSWFTVAERVPDGLSWVRYWDLAASTKESADYTASAAVALAADGTLYIRDMIRDRFEWPDAKAVIMQTMKAEPGVQHGIEEALHGLAAVQDLHRERSIAHIALRGIRVDKDKVSRALPWAARAEQGKVVLVRGPWIEQFLAEVCAFPLAEHDDQVDTVSGGLAMVAAPEVKIRWID
jgi:predicted phage terminase large subunit-like protein